MWAEIARIIIRYRLALIGFLMLVTGFMLFQAGNVKLYYGLPRMLPDDSPILMAFDEFQDRFKEESTIFVIGIEKDLFSNPELFNRWYELGRDVSAIRGVDTVLSVGSAFNIVKDTALKKFRVVPVVEGKVKNQAELDQLKARFDALPFYDRLLINPENNYSLMAISMANERFNSRERSEFFGTILKKVEDFEELNELEIKYSGMPFIREMMTDLVKKELRLSIVLTFLITILILFIFFRSVKPVVISMVVVALGVVWSLGILNAMDYEITILTSLIPPLIIVIGIPNCIYLINTFHSELKSHGNKAKALIRVVSRIGKATFMTNATTAVGFLTFTFTQSIILVEFGMIAFLSIIFLFFISLLVITITFSYLKPPKDSLTDHLDKAWINVVIRWFIHLVTTQRKWVYSVTILVVVVSLGGLFRVETTGNLVDDLPKDHPIVNDLHWFETHFGGVVPFEVEVNTGKPRQVSKSSIIKSIDETQQLFAEYPEFSRSISIADAIKFLRQAFYNGDENMYDLISSRERAFYKDYVENANADQELLDNYVDTTEQYARISLQVADIGTKEMDSLLKHVIPRVDSIFNPKKPKLQRMMQELHASPSPAKDSIAQAVLAESRKLKRILKRRLEEKDSTATIDLDTMALATQPELLKELEESLEDSFIDLVFTGPSVTFLEGTNYLVRNLMISLSIAIVIVALLMAAVFSSLRMIVISVATNLIPLLFTAAVMGYFGITIKPSTLLVFSIAFGISVDDTIHYLAKYRQELRHTKNDIGASVKLALEETGVSMVYTSIILFFGFSVFDLSEFGGTQALGILVSLTLLVAMFANLVLLPSFLMSFERRIITRYFQEPLLSILDEEEDLELDDLGFEEDDQKKNP